MTTAQDRLYHLLPYVHRQRDAQRGEPLRRFLRVAEEQLEIWERDLAVTYDNWFIETCEDWVVPYIADLIGYRPLGGVQGPVAASGLPRLRALTPRADVARAMAYERRKGTLPLLEEMARTLAGLPARAVEGYRLLNFTQSVKHVRLDRGHSVDTRDLQALADLGSAFESATHAVDVRRPSSRYTRGLYNIPSVGLFCWRLRAFPVTYCQPYLQEGAGYSGKGCFQFSVLGKDAPLFVKPQPETSSYTLAESENVPGMLSREALQRDLFRFDPKARRWVRRESSRFYGQDRSLAIWLDRGNGLELVPAADIAVADLTDWKYVAREREVLVDPERGRFRVGGRVKDARVSWHYGFCGPRGAGEYDRQLAQPQQEHRCYVVGDGEGRYETLHGALRAWRSDMDKRRHGDSTIPPRAIIEVVARGCQYGSCAVELGDGETLVIRAADRHRAVLWLSDDQPEASDALRVVGGPSSRFVLDGVVLAQRGLELEGQFDEVVIRHCTLPPRDPSVHPREGAPSVLVLNEVRGDVVVEASVVGAMTVSGTGEPVRLKLVDSIIDAGNDADFAISGDGEGRLARATLTVQSTTLVGGAAVHSVELAENSVFTGQLLVAHRQPGCVRFCFIPPGSRTPRRFRCQPDLVLEAAEGQSEAFRVNEGNRVTPVWASREYGKPAYMQLDEGAAQELFHGTDDGGEMGVWHRLYLPLRQEALEQRLANSVPASMTAGLILVT